MLKPAKILEIPAAITERGQTTVPAAIRKMLKIGKRGRVVFRGLADGTVVIAKPEGAAETDDPVIGKFLDFLARDMARRPDRIRAMRNGAIAKARALVAGVAVDLDAPLGDDPA